MKQAVFEQARRSAMADNTGNGPITLINVFEIRPQDIEPFVRQWQDRAEFMGRQPGFRSLRLHRALSPDARFQLVNVAEWDSADGLQAATAQDYFQQSAQRSMHDFAMAAHPGVYRVVLEAAAE
jgi:heme-degrading monooxygenase HmoA